MGRAVDDRIRAAIRTDQSVFGSNNATQSLTKDPHSADLSEQKSHALNLVRDSVVALDPEGHITYLNLAAEQLYGWTSLEAVGRLATTTLFARSKAAFDAAWREVREKGEWRGRIAQFTKSGAERLVESHWSAVQEKHSSKITSVLILGMEASTMRLTAAGLAHEMRNPLAGIKGVADAFLQRRQLTRQEREWMEAVRHEVMKIDARLRELLDVSQPRVFSVKQCLLSELISRVVLLATHQLNNRQITVEFIDATTEPLVMPLDTARIEDAVLNLVLNAIESIEGAGRVSVRLRQRPTSSGAGEALIEVTDTGCGIPVEIRRRIFEPLFTTKREGTGLGLAAVRRTADAYHGRITFKTRIGRGSTFVLALPLRSQLNLTENPK
jgi:PAS domain S-box-containing protein